MTLKSNDTREIAAPKNNDTKKRQFKMRPPKNYSTNLCNWNVNKSFIGHYL
ncbi:8604_t:CDS:2 [Gigaspora margarita]|uniref:8604_t:CDS:1 n=1 Tax=Gigaspora margarita TaxID=4874 RepID=A0ABN7UBT8_GIGMA|nr:8604_t:CDS:2 [Gigaspora margarita]